MNPSTAVERAFLALVVVCTTSAVVLGAEAVEPDPTDDASAPAVQAAVTAPAPAVQAAVTASAPAVTVERARAEARWFLDSFVDGDGRVVRRDQGGDTVSEGQAYAMLLAVALDDRAAFDTIWSWTRAHLQRDDGLLSWRWDDGSVIGRQPAADADLDAAWALALAHRRWPDGTFGAAATRMADAVVEHETSIVDGERVLVAGPWAVADRPEGPTVLNPSYASPVAESVLAGRHADREVLAALSEGNRGAISTVVDRHGVPTDWALLWADGSVTTTRGPTDPPPGVFGWDAARMPLRFASSCDRRDVALAARTWVPIEQWGAGLDTMQEHPARLVGAAGAAASAGDAGRAVELLDRASQSQRRAPTYYGGALSALGRMLLTTDLLGGCPPL